jgi:type II secretory pathway component PulJ
VKKKERIAELERQMEALKARIAELEAERRRADNPFINIISPEPPRENSGSIWIKRAEVGDPIARFGSLTA